METLRSAQDDGRGSFGGEEFESGQRERVRAEHASPHTHDQEHHHHTHASSSHHEHGRHLLQVSHLSVSFRMYDPDAPYFSARQVEVPAIDDLGISVHAGEIVAVVGASGSGKTLLADSIMGLFEPNARVEGEIWFDGEPMSAARLADVRGRAGGIALVPQGVAHLDPLMRVGRQVEGPCKRSERAARAAKRAELFERYGLAGDVARLYPYQLSGGMARRVLLCTALMDDPRVIIADEPTPGLDLKLAVAALADFRAFADAGGGVMLITHDLELALQVADRVAVFKDGTVVEETAVASFADPGLLRHPFTRALWRALPEHGFSADAASMPGAPVAAVSGEPMDEGCGGGGDGAATGRAISASQKGGDAAC